MSSAAQIYHRAFDADFFKLSPELRQRIEAKIDQVGLRLKDYPHSRLTGMNRYRLRVGDYRVIYMFDAPLGEIHLLAIGHRRQIYRSL